MSGADRRPLLAVVWPLAVAVLVVLVAFPLWIGWFALGGLHERSAPEFTREPSPDGRVEVVRERSHGFLDAYERLWLAPAGEQDPAQWTELAPEVDGSWDTEWWSPTHLVLTDHGAWAERRQPYRDRRVASVLVETRAAPALRFVDSPDGMFHVALWTYVDSKGRRTAARLDSTWQNDSHCSQPLVPEGPWDVAVEWLAAGRLRLRMTPAPGASLPTVPTSACGVAVEVVRG